jgi:hypothetical protein
MSDQETILLINGKHYKLEEPTPWGDVVDGPSLHEVEFHRHSFVSGDGGWDAWDPVDDAVVLCGKCNGDTFKVSSCNSNYETWAYCSCGNKFTLHTG